MIFKSTFQDWLKIYIRGMKRLFWKLCYFVCFPYFPVLLKFIRYKVCSHVPYGVLSIIFGNLIGETNVCGCFKNLFMPLFTNRPTQWKQLAFSLSNKGKHSICGLQLFVQFFFDFLQGCVIELALWNKFPRVYILPKQYMKTILKSCRYEQNGAHHR